MKGLRAIVCGAALLFSAASAAEFSDDEIRVALLTDLSSVYSKLAGLGSVIAAEMAIEDAGGEILGHEIVLITKDHESNGKLATQLAQELLEERNVDAFAGLVSSSTAIPVQALARDHEVITLISGAGSSSLTGKNCSPTGFHWTYDTYALAAGTARAVVQRGGKEWFFVTADYAFGHSLQNDTGNIVEAAGGTVVGAAAHPFKATDFSPYLLQARASGAQVVAFANAGGDTRRAIRQAYELGIMQGGQDLAALLMFLTDVRSLGLYVTSGLQLTTGFYWNMNEDTRAWSRRFAARYGAMPTMVQAGVYSSLRHYFKAIEAAGTDDGLTVAKQMKSMPVNDFFAPNGYIRADGRMVHDMYLVQVKKPTETTESWDYFKVLATIPGEEAFRPMAEGQCPYVSG